MYVCTYVCMHRLMRWIYHVQSTYVIHGLLSHKKIQYTFTTFTATNESMVCVHSILTQFHTHTRHTLAFTYRPARVTKLVMFLSQGRSVAARQPVPPQTWSATRLTLGTLISIGYDQLAMQDTARKDNADELFKGWRKNILLRC